MSEYTDKIKAKIKESDVEGKLSDLVDEGEKLVTEAVTKAGGLAHDRRDDVQGWLDKASGAVNEKTDGKYADKVTKLKDVLLTGLDKVAARRTVADEGETPTPVAEPQQIATTPGEAWSQEVDEVVPDAPETPDDVRKDPLD